MDTDRKIQQINTFNGGMNTDTSDALLDKNQYRLANNLRFITDSGENQGELHLIEGSSIIEECGDKILFTTQIRNYGIVMYKITYTEHNSNSLKDKFGNQIEYNKPYVYIVRIKNPYDNVDYNSNLSALSFDDQFCVFGPCEYKEELFGKKYSVVTRYEDKDNIKLYIANGEQYVSMFNIMKYCGSNIENTYIYPSAKLNPPKFIRLTDGKLKAGLSQYSYVLYKEKGVSTEVSATTKLIPIVNKLKNTSVVGKEIIGLEKDYYSNSGVTIQINVDREYYDKLDNIIIYRIHYIDSGLLPTVDVIYDGKYTPNTFTFSDVGQKPLQSITLEEYNSMSGIHIIPKVIESKNDLLFAANIKESTSFIKEFDEYDARSYRFDHLNKKTHLFDYNTGNIFGSNSDSGDGLSMLDIKNLSNSEQFKKFDCYNKYNNLLDFNIDLNNIVTSTPTSRTGIYDRFTENGEYYGGSGININWKFIIIKLIGDASKGSNDATYGAYGSQYNTTKFSQDLNYEQSSTYFYIKKDGTLEDSGNRVEDISKNNGGLTYANPLVSYNFKSLRRDELYRYGIIMYDKYGHSSKVKWIADIRTPSIYTKGFEPFVCKETINGNIYELSVRSLGIEFEVNNLPEECVSYEIVRCNRQDLDIATISQGVISRPIKKIYNVGFTGRKDSPLTPSGLLTTARYWTGVKQAARTGHINSLDDWREADNLDNNSIFLFVSPEVCYLKDSFILQLDKKNITINPLLYLFGAIGFDTYLRNVDSKNGFIGSVAHPGITNTSILLDLSTPVNFTTVNGNDKYELKYKDSLPNSENPLNLNLAIAMYNGRNIYSFYQTRFTNEYDITRDPVLSDSNINYSTSIRNLLFHESTPTLLPITTFDDPSIMRQHNLWYNSAKHSYSYIKLYNQSNKVLLRGHLKGNPSVDAYYNNKKQHGFSAIEANAHNKCNVLDYKMSDDLGWDDLASAQISNNKTTYELKYKNHITTIGNYNFCNWVCGGSFDLAGSDLSDLIKPNDYIWKNEGRSAIMGPGGRCLIFNIDNNWTIDTNNKLDINSENLMFTDSIGTRVITRSNGNNTEQYYAPQLQFSQQLGFIKKHSKAIVSGISSSTYDEVPIFKESIMGTYLCNLRQYSIPYGGYSYNDRLLNQYYSYGNFFNPDSKTNIVFDGDCYILPFEYVSMHKHYNNKVINTSTHSIIYSIPVETNINLTYTYGNEFSSNINSSEITNLLIEPSNVYNIYSLKNKLYSYNAAYSSYPKSRIFDSYNKTDKYIENIDYRVRYSNKKENNESYDSWTKFQPVNYIDVDTRFGQITLLKTFKNNLMFFQELAFGILSVNERTAITDNSNMPLILGTGGVLDRYDYISERNGMKESEFSNASSNTSLYWWDHDRKEICSYSGGLNINILSKEKNVLNFINYHYKQNKLLSNPSVIYDNQFNEIIFSITNGKDYNKGSLVYNENIQRFTSLYTINPTYSINFYNKLYLSSINSIYEWNINDKVNDSIQRMCFYEIAKPYVKFIINEDPQIVKVYDNQYFGGKFNDNDTYKLQFKFNTPLKLNSNIDSSKITNREYDFRFAIPRNNNSEYGDRMRGKTMQCEMTSTNAAEDFSLQYVITKFRMSCS